MTSNRPLEDWGKLIGDVPAATAILDRFLQHAELIQITGQSYRLRGPAADKNSAHDRTRNSTGIDPTEAGHERKRHGSPAANALFMVRSFFARQVPRPNSSSASTDKHPHR